jgi:hypothetical protein
MGVPNAPMRKMKLLVGTIVTAMMFASVFSGCVGNKADVGLGTLPPQDEKSSVEKNSSNETIANKWAILGADAYIEQFGGGPSIGAVAECYRMYKYLLNLGFHPSHIVILLNESFTKNNIRNALNYIDTESVSKQNATVVVFFASHGIVMPDDKPIAELCSVIGVRAENATNDNPIMDFMYDYELDEMLDARPYGKTLVHISACFSGLFAAQDTTGKLNGALDGFFTSCGGPNRIVITDSSAYVTSFGSQGTNGVWKEGLIEGKGDTAPTGNNDGKTSVEEAWLYYKSICAMEHAFPLVSQPCMNDQYPADNPEDEMFVGDPKTDAIDFCKTFPAVPHVENFTFEGQVSADAAGLSYLSTTENNRFDFYVNLSAQKIVAEIYWGDSVCDLDINVCNPGAMSVDGNGILFPEGMFCNFNGSVLMPDSPSRVTIGHDDIVEGVWSLHATSKVAANVKYTAKVSVYYGCAE